MKDWQERECSICDKIIVDGDVCDSCSAMMDEFFDLAEHISGEDIKDHLDEPGWFWDELMAAFRRGQAVWVFNVDSITGHLKSIGSFETYYEIPE